MRWRSSPSDLPDPLLPQRLGRPQPTRKRNNLLCTFVADSEKERDEERRSLCETKLRRREPLTRDQVEVTVICHNELPRISPPLSIINIVVPYRYRRLEHGHSRVGALKIASGECRWRRILVLTAVDIPHWCVSRPSEKSEEREQLGANLMAS